MKKSLLFLRIVLAFAIILGVIPFGTEKAKASTSFNIKTGYYIGTGSSRSITGLGFQPEFVLIKSDTNAGEAIFKTSSMPSPNSAFFSATADNAASQITLDSNGFTVGNLAAVNSANVRYTYLAVSGSNCSSTGDFCVGYYIGDGLASKKINTGFQPDLIWTKRSGIAASWRSSVMPNDHGQYFQATVQDAAGALFKAIDSDGFNVGVTNNANLGIYYYIAFKNTANKLNVGSFVGNSSDDRYISDVGFKPDFLLLKNANSAVTGVFNTPESYGDYSSLFTATANTANNIQGFQANGFQVGSNSNVNGAGNTIYWAAMSGVQAPASAGSFSMANGSYTGTGVAQSITGLGFTPDLVIIKHNDQATDQYAVFRTSMMAGNTTAYFSNAVADFANGITSIDSDGFTVGTHDTVNSAGGDIYYWTAFGNAWKPDKNTGSSNFIIGAYTGNGIDNRDISGLPYSIDLITTKRSGASSGAWRTSQIVGDFSLFFGATAGAADVIQQMNGGFQVGTNTSANAAGSIYWWFGFKSGANFTANNYYGTGSNQSISSVGFQPDLLWVKSSTSANSAVLRNSSQAGNAAQPFINAATLANTINELNSSGFIVGTTAESNSNSVLYRYAAWRIPDVTPPIISETTPVTTPTNDNTPNYIFNTNEVGTISYGGGCSSSVTNAIVGDNTITFNALADGTYSGCTITVTDSAGNISNSLNITPFIIDTVAPSPPIASPSSGAYIGAQSIVLSSSGSSIIRYTDDDSVPTCSLGILYAGAFDITPPETIKAIGCDGAGNQSSVATFNYTVGSSGGGGSSGSAGAYSPGGGSSSDPSNNGDQNDSSSGATNGQGGLTIQFKAQEQVQLSDEEKTRRNRLMQGTYAWWYIGQSPYPSELKPGEEVEVWIEIKNIGTATWFNNGDRVVRLGSGSKYGNENQQRDYNSEFANPDWYSANRPANILHPEVRPGWHTRFQFKIKAPANPGTYKAYFTPVVDGLAWMEDIGIYWEIKVK
uniref:Uncharacterized protein n=1 Tax=candidate division CPR3 bacterium TaxID=2268181 RepID=A0A7C4M0M1_UNCC3